MQNLVCALRLNVVRSLNKRRWLNQKIVVKEICEDSMTS